MIVPKPDRDPAYRAELLNYVQAELDNHPRGKQMLIGPSGANGCPRKIAFQLAYGAADGKAQGWAAGKGEVLHSWLDQDVFGPHKRFRSDLKLPQVVPWVAGGTLDLYDAERRTIIDFKLPGDASMEKARRGKPPEAYYGQIQIYALGAIKMGLEVERVGLLHMPMCGDDLHGDTKGSSLLTWPVDLPYALNVLKGIKRIQDMLTLAPVDKVMEALPTKDDFCHGSLCWTGNRDPRAICGGHRKTGSLIRNKDNPYA